jgi:predicted AlkP superfamily pyrophosphatase or phosphodiesterase
MRRIFPFLFSALFSATFFLSCTHKTPPPAPVVLAENAPEHLKKPIVILISIDGNRFDYAEREKAPTLMKLSREGVRSKGLISIYPSLTFPNHYSLVTGLTAEHHGLIGNHFYDPVRKEEYRMNDSKAVRDGTWYGGSPVWSTAAKNKMVTVSYFWVGSESEIRGQRPHEFYLFDHAVSIDARIDQAIAWLKRPELNRPHLITLYFSEVDSAGHKFGPESKEVKDALLAVDAGIGRLVKEGDALGLPINYIVVSDHGMQAVNPAKDMRVMDDLISQTDFKVMGGGAQMYLYALNPTAVKPTFANLKKAQKNFRVYLKKDIPARYGFKKHRVIPDILIDAQIPYTVGFSSRLKNAKPGGAHGWDPSEKNMWGTFIARGPAFKKDVLLPLVKNVSVAPLVLQLLDLTPEGPMDGTTEVFRKGLAK